LTVLAGINGVGKTSPPWRRTAAITPEPGPSASTRPGRAIAGRSASATTPQLTTHEPKPPLSSKTGKRIVGGVSLTCSCLRS